MNFKESFLHFIWQYQLFEKSDLQTTDGESLAIIKQGLHNTNAGPDFQDAQIILANVQWFGAVEIHTNSSDWQKHAHHHDQAYEKVILHVVWNEDVKLMHNDGSPLPTLSLKGKIEKQYIDKYQSLVEHRDIIPCAHYFTDIPEIVKFSMLDRALHSRQEHKSEEIMQVLEATNHNWEETTYRLLAKNFGFKVNAHPFLKLAENLPLKILLKHSSSLFQLEALLFGVAGFLKNIETSDIYWNNLQKEYQFLKHKYDLENKEINLHEWKFLRLRPANFPTIRIAQFAQLIHQHSNLFSLFTSFSEYKTFIKLLSIKQSAYWSEHYIFNTPSEKPTGRLGKSSIENIIINTVVPLLFALSKSKDELIFTEKAITLLENLPAEQNSITNTWLQLGFKNNNAFDSQASIELFNNYCDKRRCLECSIGTHIMKQLAV